MIIKKTHVYASAAAIILLIGGIFAFYYYRKAPGSAEQPKPDEEKILWMVDNDGSLFYPLDRGPVQFRRDNHSQTEALIVSKVIFMSRGSNIYGLLVLPKATNSTLPAVVLLPGAGVSKESELPLAKNISRLGIAVLVIDQRGVGETDGTFPSIEDDFQIFLDAKEPYQHLVVYDALRAFDLLRGAPFIDGRRIIIAGESFGGRVATIAAAVDRNVKGALIISSSGFDFKGKGDIKKDAFLKSIDSDHYIASITPRKIVMMHNVQDKIISLDSALASYSIAREPKRFVLVNDTDCNHGYCPSMHNGLVEGLDYLFK